MTNSTLKHLRTLALQLKRAIIALVAFVASFGNSTSEAQETNPYLYQIGTPSLREIWVNPSSGSDSNSGNSASQALRSVRAAWNRIPARQLLQTQGYKILLQPGEYGEELLPNYWEDRWGSFAAPIILQAAAGRGSVVFRRDINAYDCRYLYLIDFEITPQPAGDALHCEKCEHLLIRGMSLSGGARVAQETIKINQSQHVYIEDSNIRGAYDNAIDFVAVQYGHIVRNTIEDAGDWCAYVKGGSAYIRLEGNKISNCGTGGFTAGQGAGFEFTTPPWIHYEAYDIKFINNVVTNTEGAAVGVNGGYNILIAHNSFYRVGARSHGIEAVFGSHSCDGNTASCAQRVAQGGWGVSGGGEAFIPNRNVFILNNLLLNPPDYRSQWSHFAIYGPRSNPASTNIPNPARADDQLIIRGNVIWNGPTDLSLGVEDNGQGCQTTNANCNAAQLRRENLINLIRPELVDPESADLRPLPSGNLSAVALALLLNFSGGDRPTTPGSPVGNLLNSIDRDFNQVTRTDNFNLVGAFSLNSPVATPPGAGAPPSTPGETPPETGNPPVATTPTFVATAISSRSLSARGGRIAIVTILSNFESVAEVRCAIVRGSWRRNFLLTNQGNGVFVGISPALPKNSSRRTMNYALTLSATTTGAENITSTAGIVATRVRGR